MSSRLAPSGAITRPSRVSRAQTIARQAPASRRTNLTNASFRNNRPLPLNTHPARATPYTVFADEHRHGEAEISDYVGGYTTLEEAKDAARRRYRREAVQADGWGYRWTRRGNEWYLRAVRGGGGDDVERLIVTVGTVREEGRREDLIGELRRELRQELREEMREEVEEELRQDIEDELREEIEEELRVQLREEIEGELREEIEEELREQLREEIKEELKEQQCTWVLKVEHHDNGEFQQCETAGVYRDLASAEEAVSRQYENCCDDVQAEPDFRADRRITNGLLSYQFVWEGEGEETWDIYLEEKQLR